MFPARGQQLAKGIGVAFVVVGLGLPVGQTGQAARPTVMVKIHDDKLVVVEPDLPIDPVQRIRYQPARFMGVAIRDERNRQLHLSHYPLLKIDGQVIFPGNGGRFEVVNERLRKTAGGKERDGHRVIWLYNNLRVTMTAEVVPTKSGGAGQKRRRDAVLVRYVVENKDTQAHNVGLRVYIDTYIIDNDGAIFAAPNFPNKLLDGVELKDKDVPAYVQALQRPDLKNPGFVAHLSLNLGRALEKPGRVVLTRHGGFRNNWDMQALQSMGDSALGIFWDPKEIKPGGKRDLAYAYGQGLALGPESEGNFNLVLGGSFEPGKLFTVAAMVNDPAPGQSLTLELPAGMARLEGKEIQPVPGASGEQTQSMVLWKARVMRLGQFPLRVRSSTGVTQTKIITISHGEKTR